MSLDGIKKTRSDEIKNKTTTDEGRRAQKLTDLVGHEPRPNSRTPWTQKKKYIYIYTHDEGVKSRIKPS